MVVVEHNFVKVNFFDGNLNDTALLLIILLAQFSTSIKPKICIRYVYMGIILKIITLLDGIKYFPVLTIKFLTPRSCS